jgi:hypothetical protein
MKKITSFLIIPTITLFVFGLTNTPEIKPLVYRIFIFYLFFTASSVGYYIWIEHKRIRSNNIYIVFYIIMMTVLFWVGLSGWFFSPFFYLVYILSIAMAFIFSTFTSFSFLIVLSFLYFNNYSDIDLFLDLLMLMSFLLVIPVTYYLKRQYLYLKQKRKQILILEEATVKTDSSVDKILANKVNRFATNIRQPVNDIRQIALHIKTVKNQREVNTSLKKMADLGEKIIKDINAFEKKTTGERVIHKK